MIGPDDASPTAEVRPDFIDDRGRRHLVVEGGGRVLARLVAVEDQSRLWVAVEGERVVLSAAAWRTVLGAVVHLARDERHGALLLPDGSPLLLRYVARAAGFTGPLRGVLARDLRQIDSPASDAASPEARFVADLNALLPGLTVESARRPAGALRSALRFASAGIAGTAPLRVSDASRTKPLALAVPLAEDTMAECVAMAIDTTWAVRQRFRPLVDPVRIFYDQSVQGLRTGDIAGVAEASVRDIHLNPAFALAGELEILERQREERRQREEAGVPLRAASITVLPPFTRVDSVVAHECWHQIEFEFESRRYRDSVEFRRAVGGYFGVETLEQVIKGSAPGADPQWQTARTRLALEVSTYATTAPKEATAELFTQWWCTRAGPPPSAQFFGQVVEHFFPPPTARP